MNRGSLQAPCKGLRVQSTIGQADFLTDRLMEAITSLHYKQKHIYTIIHPYRSRIQWRICCHVILIYAQNRLYVDYLPHPTNQITKFTKYAIHSTSGWQALIDDWYTGWTITFTRGTNRALTAERVSSREKFSALQVNPYPANVDSMVSSYQC